MLACNNNEVVFRKPKLLRIGKSTISCAGLGLFAGESIAKDSFVVQYLGEIIEHDTI
jgi:SET domain-containing protein